MVFAEHVISYLENLDKEWIIPADIELIFPFDNERVFDLVKEFYTKFYNDNQGRSFLFGINPGRFGAGMTGIPFTDPIHLESECAITNNIPKKPELSSVFIYEMIRYFGGVKPFYNQFYITAVCPLGFIKHCKNYNYYDDLELYKAVKPYIIKNITRQVSHFCMREKAYSLGMGKNFKILKDLNNEYKWFDTIIPLPHPRWVMQYKRKTKDLYLQQYVTLLSEG